MIFAVDTVPMTAEDTKHLIVLGGAVTSLIGLIVWVLRSALPALLSQYREDVFRLTADFRTDLKLKRDEFHTWMVELTAAHTAEATRRDATQDKHTTALERNTDETRELSRKIALLAHHISSRYGVGADDPVPAGPDSGKHPRPIR